MGWRSGIPAFEMAVFIPEEIIAAASAPAWDDNGKRLNQAGTQRGNDAQYREKSQHRMIDSITELIS